MNLEKALKRHRYPVSIISYTIWLYYRFNNSLRDVSEQLAYRGIIVSYETIRQWCIKFSPYFQEVIKKRQRAAYDKWHLDEMSIKINGDTYILWRAVDRDCLELDVYIQKRRNKKSAIRFISRLLRSYAVPRVMVTDKLRSYIKPVKYMCPKTEHRTHKRLNNRAENAHQPSRRREKCIIKFKSPGQAQHLLSMIGKVRNIFAIPIKRYKNSAQDQRLAFSTALDIWSEAGMHLLTAKVA